METLLELWKQSIQLPGLYTFDDASAACPLKYRVPTSTEWAWLIDNTEYVFDKERKEGVFHFLDGFELQLPAAGCRYLDERSYLQGVNGLYWSSSVSVSGTEGRNVCFGSGMVDVGTHPRALAFSVRCVPLSVKLEATFMANIPIALEILEKFPHLTKMPPHELSAVIKLATMLQQCGK